MRKGKEMVAVRTITWEEASAPDFEQTTRQAWREAVAAIAEKATAKLPECAGRVNSAVKLVLAGDVEGQADGTAKVASQSNGTAAYLVVNGACSCKDFAKAPHNFCKHRLAVAIAKRAQELVKTKLADTNGQAEAPRQSAPVQQLTPLPEAPVSITLKATLHGHEVMVTLRGVDFASVKAQVEQASEWLRVQTPTQPPTTNTEQPKGWCAKHGVQMTQNHKEGRSWWSHKTADGWCKGK
jgi:SWIM zinc finger